MSMLELPGSNSINVVIRDARLSPSEERKSIVVSDGIVQFIGKFDEAARTLDLGKHNTLLAEGCLAVSGFTDLYTRLREPGLTRKGTIKSESHAALRAGFTRILCSPDTQPAIDSLATVELIRQRAAMHTSAAQVIPMAALTIGLEGENLSELATLQAAGCPVASQADKPLLDTSVLYSAMEYAASFELPLLMTARDARLGADGCAHAGALATQLGLPQIPVAAETIALSRLIELCKETGCQIHISRVSSARAVQHINDAKQAGLPVTCDTGIHHLFYTDALIAGYDAAFNSAVPFRSSDDRQSLRDGLKSGIIDAICSDHAPHDKDASLAPFPETEPGLSAYDWFVPLLLQVPEVTGLSLHAVLEKLSVAPASILKFAQPVDICCGAPANIVLLAEDEPPAMLEGLLSAGENNPLQVHAPQELGLQQLKGRVKAVITQNSIS